MSEQETPQERNSSNRRLWAGVLVVVLVAVGFGIFRFSGMSGKATGGHDGQMGGCGGPMPPMNDGKNDTASNSSAISLPKSGALINVEVGAKGTTLVLHRAVLKGAGPYLLNKKILGVIRPIASAEKIWVKAAVIAKGDDQPAQEPAWLCAGPLQKELARFVKAPQTSGTIATNTAKPPARINADDPADTKTIDNANTTTATIGANTVTLQTAKKADGTNFKILCVGKACRPLSPCESKPVIRIFDPKKTQPIIPLPSLAGLKLPKLPNPEKPPFSIVHARVVVTIQAPTIILPINVWKIPRPIVINPGLLKALKPIATIENLRVKVPSAEDLKPIEMCAKTLQKKPADFIKIPPITGTIAVKTPTINTATAAPAAPSNITVATGDQISIHTVNKTDGTKARMICQGGTCRALELCSR